MIDKILENAEKKNMDISKLEKALREYEQLVKKQLATFTYRGLLGYLSDKGIDIDYFNGIDIGLLDFNNMLFDEIEELKLKKIIKED